MDSLLTTIEREGVTHTLCLPSLYAAMLDHAENHRQQSRLDSMEVVINAGEPMPSGALLKQHRRLLPHTRIFNEYGPTEATVWCSAYDATTHNPALNIPIGKPIPGAQLFVMNQHGRLAAIGAAGELVIGGAGLSPGYWKDEDLTQQRFRHHQSIANGQSRVYHSGDLVRYAEDGNLMYLGRIDEQIKIRGYRIEPGEIEARICTYPGVSAARVIAHRVGGGSDSLAAFVVFGHGEKDLIALNTYLLAHLPGHQIPNTITAVDALPTLANGKIDNTSLRIRIEKTAQNAPDKHSGRYHLPLNDKQKCLVKIWKAILSRAEIGIHDNFFRLGGDSIASIRILSGALQAGYRLDPNDLYEAPTIDALSRRLRPIEDAASSPPPSWQSTPAKEKYGDNATDAYPLTDSQTAFLFAHLSDVQGGNGGEDPGHMQIQATIEGELDVSVFRQCCAEITNRHDALRSAIFWRDNAQPEQVVYGSCDIDIAYYPLQTSVCDCSLLIANYLQEQKAQGLKIDHAPTWRLGIFQNSHYVHTLCFSFHHALVDGWSASTVVQQIVARYQARIGHQRLSMDAPAQFHAYVHWLDNAEVHQAEQFWRRRLGAAATGPDDTIAVLPKQTDRRATSKSVAVQIAGEEFAQLKNQLQQHQITPTQLIHAAWSVCLNAASADGGIGFYTTVSGRAVPVPGIDQIVGQFTNHIPIVLNGFEDNTFSSVIASVAEFAGCARAYEHISPAQLQNWCGGQIGTITTMESVSFLLQSLVLMENFPWSSAAHVNHSKSIQLTGLQQRGQSNIAADANVTASFPLTLVGIPEPRQLTVQLHIDTNLFDVDHCTDLLQHIRQLLITWSHGTTTPIPEGLTLASKEFFRIKVPGFQDSTEPDQPDRAYSALEKSLLAIWRDILKLPVTHIQQNFFDLGGNSLTALRMAEHVESLLQLKMPLGMLIRHDTIEKLAAALGGTTTKWQTVVPIQPKGIAPPVFGIHAEGNILFYRDLSQNIGGNRPFYGLQSPELDGGDQRFTSIEEMAAHYVEEIQTIQPTGPYYLCGMCFGGWVAFEMARQMTENGSRVDALIILDSEGPPLRKGVTSNGESTTSKFTYSRKASLPIKIFRHLITGRLLEVSKTYVAATPVIYRLLRTIRPARKAESAGERIKKVRLNQEYLQRQYDTTGYTGKISFIRSEEFESIETRQYEIPRWKEICGGRLDTYLVPGKHLKLLEPPYVYEVAKVVRTILDDASGG